MSAASKISGNTAFPAISAYACRICGGAFQFEALPHACPRCGGDNALRLVEDGEIETVPKNKRALQRQAQSFELYIPPVEHYSSNVKSFDRVIGGLSKSFSIFLMGAEGVGKSTLVTTISAKHCVKFDKNGVPIGVDKTRKIFLASAEEHPQRFLARSERIGFLVTNEKGVVQETGATKHYVQVFKTQFTVSRETDIIELKKQIKKHRPSLVIFDSIRKFKHPEVKVRSFLVHGPEVINEIVSLCEEIECCAIIVARLTKDGKMAGAQDMAYDVDCVCQLERYKPKAKSKKAKIKGSTRRYVKFTTSKNREGPEGRIGWFRMGSRGLLSVNSPGKPKKKAPAAPRKRIRRG